MNEDYKIEFKDEYILIIDATETKVMYQFMTPDNKKARSFTDKRDPLEITTRTTIGTEIKKHIKDDELSELGMNRLFEKTIMDISSMVEEIIVNKKEAHELKGKAELAVKEDQIEDGLKILEEMDNPLIWIADTIDWLTAGERINILYTFITYCSQIILETPISVIGIGEPNSGKTHVEDVALLLLPQEYVFIIKTATMAVIYYYSDIDPYFFDGKIICIGDMGGSKDHEEAQEFKDIIKELQTDGYVHRQKMVKDPETGEHVPKSYELYGHPCLTYTTIPGYEFDGQELSRSVMFEPRNDNDLAVSIFKQLNRQKDSPTSRNIEKRKDNIPIIRNMIMALKKRMDGIDIYNPYNSFINKFLGESKYFKRDVDKYDGILRIITALNGYNREQLNDTIFTTKNDISFFLDLLSDYQEAIVTNLSPGATHVLNELREHEEEWDLYEQGITVNDYLGSSSIGLAKNSVQRYFGELNSSSLIKVVDKSGNSNVYVLLPESFNKFKDEIELDVNDLKMLEYNYGITDLSKFESETSCTSPRDKLPGEKEPFWNDHLPKN